MHADALYVEAALRAGGVGYLLKCSAVSELSLAVHTVLSGGIYVSQLIERAHSARKCQPPSELLTARQRQVLQLVAEGRANKEIAALLHVSEKTIDYHKASLKRGLMLGSTAELTQFAIRHHIIGI
jgi:DNA-binding NarL/FixJ family response regulator